MSRTATLVLLGVLAGLSCGRAREAGAGGTTGGGGVAAGDGVAGAKSSVAGGSIAAGNGAAAGGAGVGAAGGGGVAGGFIKVDGGVCCPADKTPGCCMNYGGFAPTPSGCFSACDGMPSPQEAWKLVKDAHGCDYWREPDEWTNCCGCAPPDWGGAPTCDPTGVWVIQFDAQVCGPKLQTISISSDNDAGAPEIEFDALGSQPNSCGPSPSAGRYEASVTIAESGCVIQAASQASWCSGNEDKCEGLDVSLRIQGDTALVEGAYRVCECANNPHSDRVPMRGTAKRLR